MTPRDSVLFFSHFYACTNLLYVTVIAGSEGVPDALQKCHSLSRDLQNNQTIIFTRLSDLKQQINNFTVEVKPHK